MVSQHTVIGFAKFLVFIDYSMFFNLYIGTYISMEGSQATTQLSSPTEATSVSVPRFRARARKRSSWTEEHMVSVTTYVFLMIL